MRRSPLAILKLLCFVGMTIAQVAVSGNLMAQTGQAKIAFVGPSPWLDITSSAYAAQCNGSTDDTTAIQAALNAANMGGGGTVYVPPGTAGACIVASTLSLNGFHQVRLMGAGPGCTLAGGYAPTTVSVLKFTGAPLKPLISAQASDGITIENLNIVYTNPSFANNIIDSTGTSETPTVNFQVLNNCIGSQSQFITSAAIGISVDKNVGAKISRNYLNNMKMGIRGASGNLSYSGPVGIYSNEFGADSAGFLNGAITGFGSAWVIDNNNFEISNACIGCSSSKVLDGSNSLIGNGITITGNVFVDASRSWSGYAFYQLGSGVTISGNTITSQNSRTASMLAMQNTQAGLTFTGNYVSGYSTVFVFGSTNNHIFIDGNTYNSVTTFMVGAPATGLLRNNNSALFSYGGLVSFQSFSLTGNTLFTQAAPTIASGFGNSPSIVQQNGTAAFEVNLGTGGSATSGVLAMPTAANGWSCQVTDMTTNIVTRETAFTTTTVTLAASNAWSANDKLLVNCAGF